MGLSYGRYMYDRGDIENSIAYGTLLEYTLPTIKVLAAVAGSEKKGIAVDDLLGELHSGYGMKIGKSKLRRKASHLEEEGMIKSEKPLFNIGSGRFRKLVYSATDKGHTMYNAVVSKKLLTSSTP